MQIHLDVSGKTTILDSEEYYSGSKPDNDNEKLIRKAIGLPVTKQLVFYRNRRDASSVINVERYRINTIYEITDRWFEIDIVTADGETVRIHSRYLVEMQSPSFIEDMRKSDYDVADVYLANK